MQTKRNMSQNLRKIDCHVHMVGGGPGDASGAWFRRKGPWEAAQSTALLKVVGLGKAALRGNLTEAYGKRLRELVRESSLDAMVVLAQELTYSDDGQPLKDRTRFYVPNDVVLDMGEAHAEFIPAVSIHPARPDAMEELERCIARGARILKLLPNVQNVNCNAAAFRPFWERVASAGMIFLAHTGGELALPVFNSAYANPRILTLPLECGVTCIAAHCSGAAIPGGRSYTAELLELFGRFPHLYADNSAQCSWNHAITIRRLRNPAIRERLIHGSDVPVPVGGFGPWASGMLGYGAWRRWQACPNPIERDYQFKLAMGCFGDSFTRLDRLLSELKT